MDVAVMGEGDQTILDILENWDRCRKLDNVKGIYYKENGIIKAGQKREVISDINQIPIPDYDIFDIEKYICGQRNLVGEPLPMDRDRIRPFLISTARGCINQCSFCYHCFVGEKYRYREPKNVIDEMKYMIDKFGANYFFLSDDLTFFSKAHISKFIDRLTAEKVNVHWVGTCRGNLFQTEKDIDLLDKIKKAGCIRLGYALESANAEILKAMNKHVSLDQFSQQKKING